MLYFENDYSEGAHEEVLCRLVETNAEKQPGYGADAYCADARDKIRLACQCPTAQVYFLAGGTQANQVAAHAMLRPYQAVVAATTGHVAAHEAGAIEATGHKVLTLEQTDGKLQAGRLEQYLAGFFADANHEHMPFPGMVYLSHPTEYGTLYTVGELEAISAACRARGVLLYVDGARLGYALASTAPGVALPDLARLADAFYIGGTKVGALCGEAMVFPRQAPPHFMTMVKQQGALLAKGRLVGVQFDALFTGGLYARIGKSAVDAAQRLQAALKEKGYRLYLESPTNQVFVVLEDETMRRLQRQVRFSFWEKADETHTVVRFATSWATRPEDVEQLIALL